MKILGIQSLFFFLGFLTSAELLVYILVVIKAFSLHLPSLIYVSVWVMETLIGTRIRKDQAGMI